jgi:ferrochelatase
MRYGQPSLRTALSNLAAKNARQLVVLPLYPQYSATTTASITDGVFDEFKQWRVIPELAIITQYYQHPGYIAAVTDSINAYWEQHGKSDKLLFSFHSIPKRYSEAGDIYSQHCEKTAKSIADKLGLDNKQWVLSYQSRLGSEEWLKPYTDETLIELGKGDTGRVDVVCPGFSADCLETLEEIDQENRQRYLDNGGREFHYIPALNDSDSHIRMITQLVCQHAGNWL